MLQLSGENKKAVEWCLRAASKESIKPVYQCVYIKDNAAYCTDSRRLHAAPVEDVENGLYSVLAKDKNNIVLAPSDAGQFPRVKDILSGEYKALAAGTHQKDLTGVAVGKIAYYLGMNKRCINTDFIYDAIEKVYGEWILSVSEPLAPIKITVGSYTAVIMPIQMKKEGE